MNDPVTIDRRHLAALHLAAGQCPGRLLTDTEADAVLEALDAATATLATTDTGAAAA